MHKKMCFGAVGADDSGGQGLLRRCCIYTHLFFSIRAMSSSGFPSVGWCSLSRKQRPSKHSQSTSAECAHGLSASSWMLMWRKVRLAHTCQASASPHMVTHRTGQSPVAAIAIL